MTVYTYHYSSSKSVGGVQELIRSLQEVVSLELNLEVVEVCDTSESSTDVGFNVNSLTFVNLFRRRMVFRSIERRLRLRSYLAKNKEGVLILFNPADVFFLPRKHLQGSKIILVQINKLEVQYGFITKQLIGWYEKYISFFTVYTDSDKLRLIEYLRLGENKIKVIPRACKLVAKKEGPAYSTRLVTICRIYENQKNLEGMVKVMALLPRNYSLDIYGVGTKEAIASLENMISAYENIQFKGQAIDVAEVLSGYAVFLMTSKYEGFGQTLIEARSQGLPLVVYDTFDAASWIVQCGANGWLVEFEDTELFAKKILLITENEEIYRQYSDNAIASSITTEKEVISSKWAEVIRS